MAFVVVVYIGTAYMFMAYIGTAYIVMAYTGLRRYDLYSHGPEGATALWWQLFFIDGDLKVFKYVWPQGIQVGMTLTYSSRNGPKVFK